MTIAGSKHPEQHLGLEERTPVTVRVYGRGQQFHDGAHSWACVGLVLQVRWGSSCLAHVFLRYPQKPSLAFFVLPPHAVEALDGKHLHVLELKHLRGSHRQTV